VANIVWAHLCDYAFKDAAGKTCLIGIFDRINARAVPVVHPQASVALKVAGEAGERLAMKIEIVRPGGTNLSKVEAEIGLGTDGEGEVQFNMVAMPLPDFGRYQINLHLGDELAHTIVFVVLQPPTTPSPH
jgi:uncharacterized protein DUF6941